MSSSTNWFSYNTAPKTGVIYMKSEGDSDIPIYWNNKNWVNKLDNTQVINDTFMWRISSPEEFYNERKSKYTDSERENLILNFKTELSIAINNCNWTLYELLLIKIKLHTQLLNSNSFEELLKLKLQEIEKY